MWLGPIAGTRATAVDDHKYCCGNHLWLLKNYHKEEPDAPWLRKARLYLLRPEESPEPVGDLPNALLPLIKVGMAP
jgi:hypothetical protein